MYSVSFSDANNGTAVGASGTILRTTDGGTNWISQVSGTTDQLRGVSFTDTNNGTVVTPTGKILRTTDGGTNWIFQTSGTTNVLLSVSFSDANNGTIVGHSGTILRTTDGGTNWTSQTSGTSSHLLAVSFTDVNKGTAVGLSPGIFRTVDGGTNWTSQTSGTNAVLNGVSFTDANNGTIVGDSGTILRTTDGGTNRTSQTSGTANILYGVSFTDANTGTAVGDGGTILRTTNGALPVELISFSGLLKESGVVLNWQTATEVNNYGFAIERSAVSHKLSAENGKPSADSWTKIAFVQGHGNSNSPKEYSFTDTNPLSGKIEYRLKQIDFDGKFEYSDEIEVSIDSPTKFVLEQNHPNPFNPSTTIRYKVQAASRVTLKVFDALGREVVTLVDEFQQAGNYNSQFSIRNYQLSSGVYFYRLQAVNPSAGSGQGFSETKKFVLMK